MKISPLFTIIIFNSFLIVSLFLTGTNIEANALCIAPTINTIGGDWHGDDGTTSTYTQTGSQIRQYGYSYNGEGQYHYRFTGTLVGSDTEGYSIQGTFNYVKLNGKIGELPLTQEIVSYTNHPESIMHIVNVHHGLKGDISIPPATTWTKICRDG